MNTITIKLENGTAVEAPTEEWVGAIILCLPRDDRNAVIARVAAAKQQVVLPKAPTKIVTGHFS